MDLASIEQQLSTAIGQQETGNGRTGVGASLYNPGALEYADWEKQYGASDAGRFARFPSLTDGFAALKERVRQLVEGGASLSTLLNTWAPVGDNNPTTPRRIADLAQQTGLDPAKPIKQQVDAGSLIPPDVSGSANPDQAYLEADQKAHPEKYQGGSTWGRVAAFAVGILCLGLGILLLRQSQVIIQQTGKAAAAVSAAV